MVDVVRYTAVYERDPDGRWTVKVPEVKGCHSCGRTIDQARERIREALGLFVDDADDAEIVDDVELPVNVARQVKAAKALREQVLIGERRMVLAQCSAVQELRAMALGHRNTGQILGLSHQRILQLEQKSVPEMPGAGEQRRARLGASRRAAKKR
jgi:predicted RNase H-like HicB family nuclease